jgi:hypothetical protein
VALEALDILSADRKRDDRIPHRGAPLPIMFLFPSRLDVDPSKASAQDGPMTP